MDEKNVNSNGVDTNQNIGTTLEQAPIETDKEASISSEVPGVEDIPNSGNNLEVFDMEAPKKKKKSVKGVLIGIILIALICVIGFGVYYVLNKNINPKKIFEDSINTLYNGIEETSNTLKNQSTIDLLNEPVNISLTAKLDSSMEELAEFTNIEYGINMGLDVKNEKVTIGASATEGSNKLIEALMAVINDRVYLKTNMFDKVIDLGTTEENDISFEDLINTLKDIDTNEVNDDVIYISKTFKDMLIGSLDEEKFSITKTEMTIASENMKVKKITYNLDKENMERTIKYLKDEMLKNDEFLDTLEKYNTTVTDEEDESERDIRQVLESEVDMSNYVDSTISLYVNSVGVVVAGDMYEGEVENLSFTYLDDKLECFVNNTDGSYIVITYKDTNGDIEYYKSNSSAEPLLIMSFGEDSVKVNLNIEEEITKIKLGVDVTNIKNENKNISADYKVTLSLASASVGNMDLNIMGEYSMKSGDLNMFDTSESVKKEELTEEDINNIINNLMPVLERFGLDSFLSNPMVEESDNNELVYNEDLI